MVYWLLWPEVNKIHSFFLLQLASMPGESTMYISNITVKNYGPIDDINIDFPFDGAQPKPIIFVGQNGTGKSLLLANIVNALVSGRQQVFQDNEVEPGKVYKYRMPSYITSGRNFSYACTTFQSGAKVEEIQLSSTKDDLDKIDGEHKKLLAYQAIPPDQTSSITSTFDQFPETPAALFKHQCSLFFPVHRFEEPAWLNTENATKRASYLKLKSIMGVSNRTLVASSPLEENRNWLLDLILDRQIYEINAPLLPIKIFPSDVVTQAPVFMGYQGQSNTVFEAVQSLLRVILRQENNIRLGVGGRKNRQISVLKNEQAWIPNLFQLSTGEIQLLNLFISIIRDFDLSESQFTGLSDIKGIVVIDEIDTHLHTSHQINILPELIASFPNVQFIITSHSPLFLVGLDQKLGTDGFAALQMPTAEPISIAEFSEFAAAYEAFAQTERHKAEIQKIIEINQRPIVFVEGDYDIRYLRRAAELLNQTEFLSCINLQDGGGSGNLDKIWRGYDNPTNSVLPQKLVLLYDCDTGKANSSKGQIYKRVIPSAALSPISIGIENLFPESTIEKIEAEHPEFIDLQEGIIKRTRNIITKTEAIRNINKDEKGHMCNWLCEHGTAEDFANFIIIFEVLEEILNDK